MTINRITLLIFFLIININVFAQSSSELAFKEIKLLGKWKIENIDFGEAVDINNDGVKSRNGLDELCADAVYLKFTIKYTAKIYYKSSKEDCHYESPVYTWHLEERMIKINSHKIGEKQKSEKKLFIILKDPEEFETKELLVVSWEKKELVVIDELNDGQDSSSACKVTYKK